MPEDSTISYKVDLAGHGFNVRIDPDERAFYDEVVKFARETFEEVSRQAVTGGARAWAMTAFQIAIEYFDARTQLAEVSGRGRDDKDRAQRIERMIRRIEDATSSA